MAASIRLILILSVLVPLTSLLVPIQFLLVMISSPLSKKIPMYWHRLVLYVMGIKVHVHGTPAKTRPLMLVANHVSWSDILVLGSITELCFIAKDEVKSWPGINYLSRLQRTVFVNRKKRSDAAIQANTIGERLSQNDVMVLFAEGTTGNGNKLLTFKSALFGAPQSALQRTGVDQIHIQPVAIAYNTLHGMPLGRYHQAIAAWPGDLALTPHLLNFFRQGAFDVDVAFGEPHIFTSETKRKEISNEVFDEVRQLFSRLRRLYHRS